MKRKLILLLILAPLLTIAIPKPTFAENQAHKYSTFIGVQNLFSTHGTNFKGAELVESYHLSQRFLLGLGVEYSHCGYHFDNGYNLTGLKFLPVYADSKMNLTTDKAVTPYLHLSAGLSFANYNRQDAVSPGPVTHISEQGFYMYSGGGISVKISGRFKAFADMGFKGYHMSLNALDINPHGFTAKLGLEF